MAASRFLIPLGCTVFCVSGVQLTSQIQPWGRFRFKRSIVKREDASNLESSLAKMEDASKHGKYEKVGKLTSSHFKEIWPGAPQESNHEDSRHFPKKFMQVHCSCHLISSLLALMSFLYVKPEKKEDAYELDLVTRVLYLFLMTDHGNNEGSKSYVVRHFLEEVFPRTEQPQDHANPISWQKQYTHCDGLIEVEHVAEITLDDITKKQDGWSVAAVVGGTPGHAMAVNKILAPTVTSGQQSDSKLFFQYWNTHGSCVPMNVLPTMEVPISKTKVLACAGHEKFVFIRWNVSKRDVIQRKFKKGLHAWLVRISKEVSSRFQVSADTPMRLSLMAAYVPHLFGNTFSFQQQQAISGQGQKLTDVAQPSPEFGTTAFTSMLQRIMDARVHLDFSSGPEPGLSSQDHNEWYRTFRINMKDFAVFKETYDTANSIREPLWFSKLFWTETSFWTGRKQVKLHPFYINQVVESRLSPSYESRLHIMVSKGCPAGAVHKLLSQKNVDDVNAASSSGATPLVVAAYNGQEGIVTALLANENINVNASLSSGATPLHFAAQQGHQGIVTALLANDNINVNASLSSGATPLDIATQKGHTGIVKVLLARQKVDVDAAHSSGTTPAHGAT